MKHFTGTAVQSIRQVGPGARRFLRLWDFGDIGEKQPPTAHYSCQHLPLPRAIRDRRFGSLLRYQLTFRFRSNKQHRQ